MSRMLYVVFDPMEEQYLTMAIALRGGGRAIYWTKDPLRAKVYKTLAGARRMAESLGCDVLDMEGNTCQ